MKGGNEKALPANEALPPFFVINSIVIWVATAKGGKGDLASLELLENIANQGRWQVATLY